jgi:N-acetylglutamate synthase-like GNAT family acetyltransferase
MEVLPFDHNSHAIALYLMLAKRAHPIPHELPATGCVAVKDNQVIAACFLRKVEGGYGMIDGLVSHPDAPSKERHEALDLAIQYCIDQAKANGIKHLVSFCLNDSTTSRAERNGFVKQPHSMVTLSIKAT